MRASSPFLENYSSFFYKGDHYELIMACLRLIKSIVNHMKRAPTLRKNKFKIPSLP
jgi:hypothetical protein